MNFYLGCAVWSFKGWVGNLYPSQSRASDFLNLYSQRFNTVEGNTTFYAVPAAATIAKWVSQTLSGFKFCPKFPRQITHQGLLSSNIAAASSFLERIAGLGDRLGIVFAQLPPSYSPEYIKDLRAFLSECSQYNCSLAVEVRHLDWFESANRDRFNQMLTELNINRVLLDTRPIYNSPDESQVDSARRKPKVPLQPIVTGDSALVRFISHPQLEHNQSWLREWASYLKDWLGRGKTVYFFVHCPLEERSPITARYFQQLLKQNGVKLPSLI